VDTTVPGVQGHPTPVVSHVHADVGEGVVDRGVAVPAVGGHGAGCATGPVFHPLDRGGQLWCVRRVSDLHVVIKDDAVVVVDDLALVTKLDRSTTPSPTSACTASSFPAKGNPAWPDNNWNDAEPSVEPSNGERNARVGSVPSNADTAGTAPAWTASKEPKPGPDKGSSPTT